MKPIYEFGAFRLDPAERLLLRPGSVVPLTPKSFDLLVYLVERHGRLIEARAPLCPVPDAIVEEANLAPNVSALRKVLDTGAEGESLIQTVPTKRYRFVGTVTAVASIVAAEPATDAVRSEAAARHQRRVWSFLWWVRAGLAVGLALLAIRGRSAATNRVRANGLPAMRVMDLTALTGRGAPLSRRTATRSRSPTVTLASRIASLLT
jgi:DNA-binding winged helix-turn-helix (wHTH) protein